MCAIVDARFAGGSIVVAPLEPADDTPALVQVELPGFTLALFPAEARALAEALTAAVGAIE